MFGFGLSLFFLFKWKSITRYAYMWWLHLHWWLRFIAVPLRHCRYMWVLKIIIGTRTRTIRASADVFTCVCLCAIQVQNGHNFKWNWKKNMASSFINDLFLSACVEMAVLLLIEPFFSVARHFQWQKMREKGREGCEESDQDKDSGDQSSSLSAMLVHIWWLL